MLWNPLSVIHREKNIPGPHSGPLVRYSLHCACTATARLWAPASPKCHLWSITRNRTSPCGLFFWADNQGKKHRKATWVEPQSKAGAMYALSGLHFQAADPAGYRAGRTPLILEVREKLCCPKPSAIWGEKHIFSTINFFVPLWLFEALLRTWCWCNPHLSWTDGQQVMRHRCSLIVCI